MEEPTRRIPVRIQVAEAITVRQIILRWSRHRKNRGIDGIRWVLDALAGSLLAVCAERAVRS